MAVTKQDVIDRLKPLYEMALRERTGVTFLMTEEEQNVFSRADLEALEVETGYRGTAVNK